MKTFLEQLADKVLARGGNDFSDLCVVLPNRRAGVFFREALSRSGNHALWAPEIRSIEDLVFDLHGSVGIDPTTLLFLFHHVHSRSAKEPQELETFANWAQTFLADINEVDLNLIDAEDIFKQLYSVERIARWNVGEASGSPIRDRHLEFVRTLHAQYVSLRDELASRKLAYQGMAFRSVAEQVDTHISNAPWSEVWFAGFNALTVSEERIIAAWCASGKAKMFWDMDRSYAEDPMHEAGHYFRKYRKEDSKLPVGDPVTWMGDRLQIDSKQIHLIAVQRNVAQTEVAASILHRLVKDRGEAKLRNVAVILNDESLLIPLLHALPKELDGVNITMGYGLTHSQAAVFTERLFALYERFVEQGSRFYHQHVTDLLNDPFYRSVSDADPDAFLRSILNNKRPYLTVDELAVSPFHQLLFSSEMSKVGTFLPRLRELYRHIHQRWMERNDHPLEDEFLYLFDRTATRLYDLTTEYGGVGSIRTLHTFWKQLVRNLQLDFVGEPLEGLQVMGMLETRNLDFEEIIMLGVNEGNLPSTAHTPSYFTFDIRRAFGLACQNERDSVTAYHFYRLMHRAKRIHLIYDQDTDSLGRGEVSRYVKQLQVEHAANMRISEWGVEQVLPEGPFAPELTIPKGEQEMNQVLEQADKGLSPSALNTFRACSLKYYFRYVAGYGEEQEFTESVDHAILGTAVHNTLERLYMPFIGKPLSAEALKEMKKSYRPILLEEFGKEVALDDGLAGKNLLAFEVCCAYVERCLEHDVETISDGQVITPLQLEGTLRGELAVVQEEATVNVKLKGLADRVDRLSDGTVRLIDYKTGTSKKNVVKDVSDFEKTDFDHAFQLLLYTMAFSQQQPDAKKLLPSIFYLREANVEKNIEVRVEGDRLEGDALIGYATEVIGGVVGTLLDPSVPFSQTEDLNVCKYCDFNQICQRGEG